MSVKRSGKNTKYQSRLVSCFLSQSRSVPLRINQKSGKSERTEKIVCDTYIFKEKLDNYNNYFTNPSQQSCFVYDKSERITNKHCNLC